jgi:asparagine synthase (glutamine-hydrolysing)
VGEWFRSGSYEWLKQTLHSSEMLNRFFQRTAIDDMLERHRAGSANFTRELRALAALALWDEGRGLAR